MPDLEGGAKISPYRHMGDARNLNGIHRLLSNYLIRLQGGRKRSGQAPAEIHLSVATLKTLANIRLLLKIVVHTHVL